MSDLTFDLFFKAQADPSAVERMRNSVRSFHSDVTNVNQMLVQNRGNLALGQFGDRLDITKIRAAGTTIQSTARAANTASFDFKDLAGSVLGFTSAVGLITTVALGAITAVRELVAGTQKMADEADSARNRLNVQAESYQTFTAIMRDAGQEASVVAPSIDRLGQVIGDALVDKAGPAAAALAKVQLTAEALKGMPREMQLELVAVGLERISDAEERSAAAKDLLGRGASQLTPLLLALANEGLASLVTRSREAGTILSEDMVSALDQVGDRSEEAARKMQVTIAPAVLLWKELKAGVAESLASMIDFEGKFRATDLFSPGKIGAKINYAMFGAPGEKEGKPGEDIDAKMKAASQAAEAETLAFLELEDQKKKKLAQEQADLDIANAAAKKAQLQQQVEAGNALFLKAEEDKRKAAEDSKNAELELEADLALARRKALQDEIEKGNAIFMQWQEEQKLVRQKASEKELNDALLAQTNARVALENDWRSTAEEKDPLIRRSLEIENGLIAARIELLKEERNTADPLRAGQIDQQVGDLSQRSQDNTTKLSRPSKFSVGDQLTSASVAMSDSIGTVPEQVGRAWGDMAESMRGSFRSMTTDLLMYGGSLSDGLTGMSIQIGQAFLSTTAGMVSDWFMKHMVMDNVRRLFNVKRMTEEAAVQGALTTAHTVGETTRLAATASTSAAETGIVTAAAGAQATATGIASVFRSIMELGPIAGPLVLGASIVGTIALVMAAVKGIGKHATGTIVRGPGTGTSDSIPAYLSDGEAVIPSNRVRQYGPRFIQDIIEGRAAPGSQISNTVASSTSGGTESKDIKVAIAIVRAVNEAKEWLSGQEGKKMIVGIGAANRAEFGIES